MTETEQREAPLFQYRAYSPFIGLAVGPALFILLVASVVLPGGASAHSSEELTAVLILIFDTVLILLSVISLSRRVWSMKFYDDRFAVRARNLSKEFRYSQVKDAQHFRVFSGFQNRDIVTIDVEGDQSFTISGNPKNKVLKTDLFHWIQSRIPARTDGGR